MSIDRLTGRAFCFSCGYRTDSALLEAQLHPEQASCRTPSVGHLLAKSRGCHEDLAAEVSLSRRRISSDTAAELGLRVVPYRGEDFIGFPYFITQDSLPVYWKLRPTNGDKKPMVRVPRGVPSILYNQPALESLRDDEAPFIVEGEFDVVALHEAGEFGAVSVPNGAMTQLSDQLLKPLHRFHAFFIGVDNDAAGDQLAARLQAALRPRTCLRITWHKGL